MWTDGASGGLRCGGRGCLRGRPPMHPSSATPFCRVLPAHDQVTGLGESFGHLAHDFNNLFAAIAGSATLIELGGGQTPDTLRHVHNIHAATDRGARVLQQLLALSPRTDGPLAPCTVGDVLLDAKANATGALGAAYLPTFFAPEGIPSVVADGRQIQLAIGALIENARDAMPQGGAIVVTARVRTLSDLEATAAGVSAGDYLAFTVQDAGAGIPAAAAERLGTPFFTTKPKGKGAGLGLAVVNRIARRHGGFVLVDSEAGAGTRVTCHFRLGLPPAD